MPETEEQNEILSESEEEYENLPKREKKSILSLETEEANVLLPESYKNVSFT